MFKVFYASLIIWLSSSVQATFAFPNVPQLQEEALQTFQSLYQQPVAQQAPLIERIKFFAQAFLGKPYELGALGEGLHGNFDQYPLYRSDAFDCETYVETILALALSQDTDSFQSMLNHIRYDQAKITYITRNHFTSLDWNPHNQQQGLIQDITTTWINPCC